MGRSVTTGDFDGDGIVDLAIGASGVYPASDQTGKVLGYLGPVVPGQYTAADATFVIQGENVYDMFGTALATVDADGDALDDLVVGAQGWNGGQGKVYLFHAADVLDGGLRW